MEDGNILTHSISGGFGVIASNFVYESLNHMIPWFIVTAAVIVCDLICGIRKSALMGEKVRFSRAVRATMGKAVIYYSFVVMICMIDVAAGGGYGIDKWSCLLVCFIECCSICGNILRPKGIEINIVNAIAAVFGKRIGVSKEELNEIIEKEENHESNIK